MPKVTLIESDGTRHVIDAVVGTSLMQSAIDNGVPGIDGDCGGVSSCGTCHCFVGDGWQSITGTPDDLEESMLSMRPDLAVTSRLSCQIFVSDEMNGLVIELPEFQM